MMNLKILFFLFLFIQTPHLFAHQWQEIFQEKVMRDEKPEWMMEQIKRDLQPFTKITKKQLGALTKQGKNHVLRVEITHNHINIKHGHSKKYHTKIITRVLKEIAQLVALPNVDFVICLNDAFYHFAPLAKCKGPLFSFAKRRGDRGIILFPDAEALDGYDSYLSQINEGAEAFPWDLKEEKAFWRGANSGFVNDLSFMNTSNLHNYPRVKLVEISTKYPDYIDARFSVILNHVNQQTAKKIQRLGYLGDPVSPKDHLKYKYQILVDGYTCAFARAYWQLFSNSVILKQTSPDIQWYYHRLVPYVHYIPVANDFSDLIEKIEWARENDKQVCEIVQNANALANDTLHYEDIMLYVYLLLTEYSKLQETLVN